MGHIAVSGLAYAHPGGDVLFHDVSFRLPAGRHAAPGGESATWPSRDASVVDMRERR